MANLVELDLGTNPKKLFEWAKLKFGESFAALYRFENSWKIRVKLGCELIKTSPTYDFFEIYWKNVESNVKMRFGNRKKIQQDFAAR